MTNLLEYVPNILAVLGIVIGGYIAIRGNRAVTETEATASPYEALARRVVDLEKSDAERRGQIEVHEKTIDALTTKSFILEKRLNIYTRYYQDLHNRWEIHRQKNSAPVIKSLWFDDTT